jgi:hypothetical protein
MRRAVVLALSVCACTVAVFAFARSNRAAPPDPPKDELRWVPVPNDDVFTAIGARVWRVHVPAALLQGKKHIAFTMERTGEKEPALLGRADVPERAEALEVTAVLHFDDANTATARRLSCALVAAGERAHTSHANPVAGFDRFGQSNELKGFTAAGAELCQFSTGEGNDARRVRFVLRLE